MELFLLVGFRWEDVGESAGDWAGFKSKMCSVLHGSEMCAEVFFFVTSPMLAWVKEWAVLKMITLSILP